MPRGRHGATNRLRYGLIAGLAFGLVGGSCSDRPVADEEPPPDIVGLCKAHCVRVMECVWHPGSSAEFSTEDGCRHNCETTDVWWNGCSREAEAMLACTTKYDCPEFAVVGTEYPDGDCVAEISDLSTCRPRSSR
jgi:hypothetical protein